MNKKFKYGFTLQEILTAFVILLAIIGVATAITMNLYNNREGRLDKLTKNYYSDIQNTYEQIISDDAPNGNIADLNDINNDNTVDGKDLRELFNRYMDGESLNNCSKLGNFAENTSISDYLKEAACSQHQKNVVIGYYLDTSCRTQVKTKEAFTKDSNTLRIVDNACGYIIYGFQGSKGPLGYDVYTIPLGKTGLKK